MSTSKNENRFVNPEKLKKKQADGTGVVIDVRTRRNLPADTFGFSDG